MYIPRLGPDSCVWFRRTSLFPWYIAGTTAASRVIVSLIGVVHGLHATAPPGSRSPPAHPPTMWGCGGVWARLPPNSHMVFYQVVLLHIPPFPQEAAREAAPSLPSPSQCIHPWGTHHGARDRQEVLVEPLARLKIEFLRPERQEFLLFSADASGGEATLV